MGKTTAVFGATGQQGGAVVRAMLKDKQYTIRAITRNPESEAAIKLKQQGKVKVKQQGKVKIKQYMIQAITRNPDSEKGI